MDNNEELKEALKQIEEEKEKTQEVNQGDKYVVAKLLFVLACIIFIIYCVVSMFSNNSSETNSKSSSTDYKLNAYVMSQGFIKDYLTSPSTAKFPNYSKINVVQTNNRFKIEAYVDSENSFGATVRTNYYMILERNDDESWTKISCDIK